jgi:hypothetical protein
MLHFKRRKVFECSCFKEHLPSFEGNQAELLIDRVEIEKLIVLRSGKVRILFSFTGIDIWNQLSPKQYSIQLVEYKWKAMN